MWHVGLASWPSMLNYCLRHMHFTSTHLRCDPSSVPTQLPADAQQGRGWGRLKDLGPCHPSGGPGWGSWFLTPTWPSTATAAICGENQQMEDTSLPLFRLFIWVWMWVSSMTDKQAWAPPYPERPRVT